MKSPLVVFSITGFLFFFFPLLKILDFHGTITTSSNKKFRKILMNILETRLLDETYRKKVDFAQMLNNKKSRKH